jgi:putative SbcD/Mre11-related phosphoesterase
VNIRPLYPHAALLLEHQGRKYIAISDLHIGIEGELASKGITVKPNLVADMVSEISCLIDSQEASGIILLGDVKHTVREISKQEWDDVPGFLRQLTAKGEVYLVPGNHDGNIRHLVPSSLHLISSNGMALDDTLLVHGHTMPSDMRSYVRQIVMGHLHPIFLKRGSVINGERVWIYLQVMKDAIFSQQGLLDIIVVPSFNPFLYATSERIYHKSISPIMKRIMQREDIVQKCIIVTLNGSVVGNAAILQYIL